MGHLRLGVQLNVCELVGRRANWRTVLCHPEPFRYLSISPLSGEDNVALLKVGFSFALLIFASPAVRGSMKNLQGFPPKPTGRRHFQLSSARSQTRQAASPCFLVLARHRPFTYHQRFGYAALETYIYSSRSPVTFIAARNVTSDRA